LEKVLHLRQQTEDEARLELGRAVSALNQIEQSIQAHRAERELAVAGRFTSGSGQQSYSVFENYIARLDAELEQLVSDAEKAQELADAAREAYVAASAERKGISKLREHALADYKKEFLKNEEQQIDDLHKGEL
jgi:flagellar FliJ protein